MTDAERARQITDVLDKHGIVHHEIGVAHGMQIQAKMPADSPARLDLNGLHIVVPARGRLNFLIERRWCDIVGTSMAAGAAEIISRHIPSIPLAVYLQITKAAGETRR